MASGDDLERRLDEWGESATPPVDGAFANRLEASLRHEMVTEPAPGLRGWLGQLLRPGVLVVAAAVLIAGFALASRPPGDGGLADDSIPLPETTTTDEPATTTSADLTDVAPTTVPAVTDVLPVPTTTAEQIGDPTSSSPPRTGTTLPPGVTRAPPEPDLPPLPPEPGLVDPDDLTTTIPGDVATTIPPVNLVLGLDGRQVIASWTFERADTASISGWVLLATDVADGPRSGEIVASSRDVSVRQLTAPVSDLATTFRIEGRSADGTVIVSSDEVSLNRGQ